MSAGCQRQHLVRKDYCFSFISALQNIINTPEVTGVEVGIEQMI